MSKKHKNMNKDKENKEQKAAAAEAGTTTAPDAQIEDILDAENVEEKELEDLAAKEENLNADLRKELDDTKAALEKEKKEYLFLMADFDNFRKRVLKEKADLIKNGAEKVLLGLLPIVDDFERGLQATKDSEDAASVREGMELIYNKLVKYLADNGVKAMETPAGTPFDAELHEAIAKIPSDEGKDQIVDTVQKGYMLNDKVLRHAKVAVN